MINRLTENTLTERYFRKTWIFILILLFCSFSKIIAQDGIYQRWVKRDGQLRFLDASGLEKKSFLLTKTDLDLYKQKPQGEKIKEVSGNVAGDGKYGWILVKEITWLDQGFFQNCLFQFYGQNGELIWEKKHVAGAVVSDNGSSILLFEAAPGVLEAPMGIEPGDMELPYTPVIYDETGSTLLQIDEGHSRSAWGVLTKNGKFGSVECTRIVKALNYKNEHFIVLVNIPKKEKKTIVGIGLVELSEDGGYKITRPYQEFNPITKKYGESKRKVVAEGKIN